MDDSAIIDRLGGTFEVARLCEVKPPSVSQWRRDGIPQSRRMYLRVIRPDVFELAEQCASSPAPDQREAA